MLKSERNSENLKQNILESMYQKTKVYFTFKQSILKTLSWDFPGGPVVKNTPAKAGNMSSISSPGTKISQTTGQLSLQAQSPCSAREAIRVRRLLSTTRESLRAATKTQHSPK